MEELGALGVLGTRSVNLCRRKKQEKRKKRLGGSVLCFLFSVQNVNIKGTSYSMWIIVRKCNGGCMAC